VANTPPNIGVEGADQGEDSPTKPRCGKTDIRHGEDHEGEGVERHALDEPAIGGDFARVHAVVDHADAKEQRAETKPCEIIRNIACMPECSA